jgi:hypothetical protein
MLGLSAAALGPVKQARHNDAPAAYRVYRPWAVPDCSLTSCTAWTVAHHQHALPRF